jgi:hypothetical protein
MARKPMSDEQKARLAENLQKARQARAAKAVEVPEVSVTTEIQCEYCGVRFDADIIERHLLVAHQQAPGAIPEGPEDVAPGTIIRPEKGLPYKKRWTKAELERRCNEGLDGFTWVTIIPSRSKPVTWNSISYYLVGGEDNRVPSPIAAIYQDSERDTARAVTRAGIAEADGTRAPRMQVYRQSV